MMNPSRCALAPNQTIQAPPLMKSVLEAVGNTPMVELSRAVAAHALQGRILAKLEYFNPGHSKKDRVALEMLRQARRTGVLQPEQWVVELTSGNTGTGLAIACRAMGHPFMAVMSSGNTPERAAMMRAFGARVELVAQAPGGVPGQVSGADLNLVAQRTEELVQEYGAFRANQFELSSNTLAHERGTGPEIWEQTEGRVDAFVDFSGTAGAFTGVMRYLRSRNTRIRGYLLEPASAAAVAGRAITQAGHRIQGGGYAIAQPPLLDRKLVTDYLTVTDEQAISGARELAEREGVFGGFSAGANYAAALQLLKEREAGATVVILICDSGLKYMSTDLYR